MPIEFVKPDTHIDFIGKRHIAAALSIALILASLIAIPIRGIRLGIDFAGGTEVQVAFASSADLHVDEGVIRDVLGAIEEIQDPSVVRYGDPNEETQDFLIRFQGDINVAASEELGGGDTIDQLGKALSGAIGPVEIERVDFVGPRVGAELRRDGALALLYASIAILIYIAIRFSTRFAPGAIVAVIHDLTITAGVFVILGFEFDLRVLAAWLAILGYSLNDTIIIYDRIRENMELRTTHDLPEVLNQSVNQTLSRTVLTSGTTLAVLVPLFLVGGEMIRPFALAMIIGVGVGTYSSIYVASPVLLFLENRYGANAPRAPLAKAPVPAKATKKPQQVQRNRGKTRKGKKGKARG